MKQIEGNKIEEIKIAEGIYFTDFRSLNNQQQPQSFITKKYIPPNQMLLLLEDFNEFNNKLKQLKYSIEEIQNEDDWEKDPIYKDAIEENYLALFINLNRQIQILEEIYKQDPESKIFNEYSIEKFKAEIEIQKQKFQELKGQFSGKSNQDGIYL